MAVYTNLAGTLLGPLTTTFSIPTTCTYLFKACPTCTEFWQGQICGVPTGSTSGMPGDHTGCWPPTNPDVVPAQPPFFGWGYYSPGLACPTGYTSACTAVYGETSEWDVEFALRPKETAMGCCPSGYTCTNHYGNTCIAKGFSPTVVPTAQCSLNTIVDLSTGPLSAVSTQQTFSKIGVLDTFIAQETGTITLWAPMFQLNFQSADLVATFSNTDSSSTVRSTSQEVSSSVSTTSGQPGSPMGTKLSDEAKIGIGVGVAFGLVLLVVLGGILFYRRQRLGSKAGSTPELDLFDTAVVDTTKTYGPAELAAERLGPAELPVSSYR